MANMKHIVGDVIRQQNASYLLHILHLTLQTAVICRISTVETLSTGTVSVIPVRNQKRIYSSTVLTLQTGLINIH